MEKRALNQQIQVRGILGKGTYHGLREQAAKIMYLISGVGEGLAEAVLSQLRSEVCRSWPDGRGEAAWWEHIEGRLEPKRIRADRLRDTKQSNVAGAERRG